MHPSQPTSAGNDRDAILIFNDLRFAHLSTRNKDLISQTATSEPSAPSDVHGYFSRDARGVHLYKPNGDLEAYLVANPQQGFFAVSAWTPPQSAARYMFSTCSTTEKWLSIEDVGMLDLQYLIKGIALERRAPVAAAAPEREDHPAVASATGAAAHRPKMG